MLRWRPLVSGGVVGSPPRRDAGVLWSLPRQAPRGYGLTAPVGVLLSLNSWGWCASLWRLFVPAGGKFLRLRGGQRLLMGEGGAEAQLYWPGWASLLDASGIAFAPVGLTRGHKQLSPSLKGAALGLRRRVETPPAAW